MIFDLMYRWLALLLFAYLNIISGSVRGQDTLYINELLDSGMSAGYSPVISLPLFEKAADIAEKNGFKPHEALAKKCIGVVYYYTGDYDKCLKYWERSNEIYTSLNERQKVANNLNNVGNVYMRLGNFGEAMKAYRGCMKISSELGNNRGKAAALGNMGNIAEKTRDYKTALKLHRESYAIDSSDQHILGMATTLTNIGTIYESLRKYDLAFQYHTQAQEFYTKLNDSLGIATGFSNLGNLYLKSGDTLLSRNYHQQALQLNTRLHNAYGMSLAMNNLADISLKSDKTGQALRYYQNTYRLAIENGFSDILKSSSKNLFKIYQQLGKKSEALEYLVVYQNLMDSVFSDESVQELARQQMLFEYDKKVLQDSLSLAAERREQALQSKLKQEELDNERNQKYIAIGALSLLTILVILLFRLVFLLRKSGKIQNRQMGIIETQRQEVDAKNKLLREGMAYGSLVQKHFLPDQQQIKNLPFSCAVWHQPCHELGGDFYWTKHIENVHFVAVADCTGHGVPGALLSLMAHGFLEEIVKQDISPAEILNQLHIRFTEKLKKKESNAFQDGLDISLIRIDSTHSTVQFSGARNNGLIYNGTGWTSLEATRRSIGLNMGISGGEENIPFNNIDFALKEAAVICLYTDGICDQFGSNLKKFGIKNLKKTLSASIDENVDSMLDRVQHTFNTHRETEEQMDDICVMILRTNDI
jgi:serine phosphatase RsbU (regulator of sigma subunit)